MFEILLLVVAVSPIYIALALITWYLSNSTIKAQEFDEKLDLVLDALDLRHLDKEDLEKAKDKANILAAAGKIKEADKVTEETMRPQSQFKDAWKLMAETQHGAEFNLEKLRQEHDAVLKGQDKEPPESEGTFKQAWKQMAGGKTEKEGK